MTQEEMRSMVDDIPYFSFPPHWKIKIIPPFAGAAARFTVEANGNFVSIFLDAKNNLGCMSGPYWEVYSTKTDDIERFMLNESDELLAAISAIVD